jgi:hypothetical protein
MRFLIELTGDELCYAAQTGALSQMAAAMRELGESFARSAGEAARLPSRAEMKSAAARFAETPERAAMARAAVAACGADIIDGVPDGRLAELACSLRALGAQI